jgi:HSP20 family protein
MLMRFDPFRDLDALTQALAATPSMSRGSQMAMDAYRDGDRFVIHLDLPGVDPDSIDLTVEKNVLTVTAERNWQPSEGQEVVVNERRQGRFTRQLFLGDSLDTDRLEASYDRGVLTITIPVAEKAKPRHVQVQVTGENERAIETSARPAEADSGQTSDSTSQDADMATNRS